MACEQELGDALGAGANQGDRPEVAALVRPVDGGWLAAAGQVAVDERRPLTHEGMGAAEDDAGPVGSGRVHPTIAVEHAEPGRGLGGRLVAEAECAAFRGRDAVVGEIGDEVAGVGDHAERTQEDLAHEVGLTAASLRRIERAHATPTWSTVRALAKALGVTLEQLGAAVEKQENAPSAPMADGRSRRR